MFDQSFEVLATLFFLSCSISTSFTVLVYFILKRELHRRSSRLMFAMALADLMGATFWFADIMSSVCPLFLILNLYGYQAAQFWSCIMGLYLVLKFSGKKIPPEIVFHLIAWSTPFISQVVVLSLRLYKQHPNPQGCWVGFGTPELFAVALPQWITVLINSFFLGIIIFRRTSSRNKWGFRARDKSLFFIQVCCMVTTFAGALQSIPNAPKMVYTVSYMLGASQGLFNTLAMRQAMVGRLFNWGHKVVRSSLVNPHLLAPVTNPDALPDFVSPPPRSNNVDEEDNGGIIAPSSAVFRHFGTYKQLPSTDLN